MKNEEFSKNFQLSTFNLIRSMPSAKLQRGVKLVVARLSKKVEKKEGTLGEIYA